ncbi:MAG: metal-dependent hydrolase [Candidatus Tritonobacter lacicola]|nr:metal-dependent hydrolase [Candidatus Tritonobacter lacicola]
MPKITYLGHSGFVIEGRETSLVIDPFLEGNPLAVAEPSDIKADYVLVTHGHPDHLGDSIAIAKANGATVIAPFELATYCEGKGAKAHPMHIGGGYDFPFGRVKLTIAHHGSAVPGDSGMEYAGSPCGFLVEIDGKNIYHAGDTGLFLDMKLIGELTEIDAALLPVGGNFTMDVDDAVRAVEFLRPKLAVPMHYNTFDVIKADPDDFRKKVEALKRKAAVLKAGESIEI